MDRRVLVAAIGSVLLVGAAGILVATAEQDKGPVFIPGDQPVSEDQIRQKLQSEGYSNVQIVRQGGYFEAMASKDGQTGKIVVDSQKGTPSDR
jgi:UDP-N-acetyl-D-mannosaminuronic acid transferase (WecB/TagA/CpsF family)